MERQVWNHIVAQIHKMNLDVRTPRQTFSLGQILRVFLWAALPERPIYWACRPSRWPQDLRPARLPTPSTMTRRTRHPNFDPALLPLERRLRGRPRRRLVHIVDGKPPPISRHSQDPDAGYDYAAGAMAKGYKLHLIATPDGSIRAWSVQPMQVDEAKVAARILPAARICGYLLADANYDRNPLYDLAWTHQVQLLAPRRYGCQRGLEHHRHSPARLRSIELLERSATGFGPLLFQQRRRIEGHFGSLSASAFGLPSLPPGVRRLERVHRWVAAKLSIRHCARRIRKHAA